MMACRTVSIKDRRDVIGKRRVGVTGGQLSRLPGHARTDENQRADSQLGGTNDDRSLSHRNQVGLM
jgi:hypothetical protein